MNPPIWITEAEVASLLDLPDAIEVLRHSLPSEARGAAVSSSKAHAAWDSGGGHAALHAVGGALLEEQLVGMKTWTHTPGGACPLLILFDTTSGQLVGIIEAFALGQMRTAAMSGLATDLLARADAQVLAIAGSGKQSLAQVAAVTAVRAIQQVVVWSRTADNAARFAERVTAEVGVPARVASSVATLVTDADVITLATRATSPFLEASMPATGCHINAIGAITPERAEFEASMLKRADLMVVDSVGQARELASELQTAFGASDERWGRVRTLSDLLLNDQRRPPGADITVFKALGLGLADVALGGQVLARARSQSLGHPVDLPRRVSPRLTRTALRKEDHA